MSSETDPHVSRLRRAEDTTPFKFPAWVLTIIQMLLPACLAIIVMYVKIGVQERDIEDLKTDNKEQAAKIMQLEISNVTSKNFADSNRSEIMQTLRRVEEDIKELKSDVKDLTKKKIETTFKQ